MRGAVRRVPSAKADEASGQAAPVRPRRGSSAASARRHRVMRRDPSAPAMVVSVRTAMTVPAVTVRQVNAPSAIVPTVSARRANALAGATGLLGIVPAADVRAVRGPRGIVPKAGVLVATAHSEIARKANARGSNAPTGIDRGKIAAAGMSGLAVAMKAGLSVARIRRAERGSNLGAGMIVAGNARATVRTVDVRMGEGSATLSRKVVAIALRAASGGLRAESDGTVRRSRVDVREAGPRSGSRAVIGPAAGIVRARRVVDVRRARGADARCAWLPGACAGVRC
jgi:hypothetical protein